MDTAYQVHQDVVINPAMHNVFSPCTVLFTEASASCWHLVRKRQIWTCYERAVIGCALKWWSAEEEVPKERGSKLKGPGWYWIKEFLWKSESQQKRMNLGMIKCFSRTSKSGVKAQEGCSESKWGVFVSRRTWCLQERSTSCGLVPLGCSGWQ